MQEVSGDESYVESRDHDIYRTDSKIRRSRSKCNVKCVCVSQRFILKIKKKIFINYNQLINVTFGILRLNLSKVIVICMIMMRDASVFVMMGHS